MNVGRCCSQDTADKTACQLRAHLPCGRLGSDLGCGLSSHARGGADYSIFRDGGRRIGDLNPLLYEVAQGAERPAFRDVTLGGNAVDDALPGYDLVTGLGTPQVANLADDLLAVQRTWRGVR